MNRNKSTKVLIALVAIIVMFGIFTMSACSNETVISAYDIAVKNGFVGTEQEWLASLKGADGKNGEDGAAVYRGYSAYEVAVIKGFKGTELEWLASLTGKTGDKGETDISAAVNKAILSVVSIVSNFKGTVNVTNIWGQIVGKEEKEYAGAGSGIIFKDDKASGVAYIVTNYHVVYDVNANSKISNDIKIYLYGLEMEKYAISAQYIGGSMTYDLAVLKITASDTYKNSNAIACTFGVSKDMSVGDSVIAIGNPSASGISVTAGVLSKDSEYLEMNGADGVTKMTFRVMRIDAAVNGGNSGGGLFDDSGNLVGIVNAKIVSNEIEGMAFAIPVDLVGGAINNIVSNCEGTSSTAIKRCLLGFTMNVVDSKTNVNSATGKVTISQSIGIKSIDVGSAAEKAGVKIGDIIVSMEYKSKLIAIDREFVVTDYSLWFKEGEVVYLNILRGNENLKIAVTLGAPIIVQ
ncbi:MAG: trypsin-like peptidase domain-containing protein [Clostridia bacterium]